MLHLHVSEEVHVSVSLLNVLCLVYSQEYTQDFSIGGREGRCSPFALADIFVRSRACFSINLWEYSSPNICP